MPSPPLPGFPLGSSRSPRHAQLIENSTTLNYIENYYLDYKIPTTNWAPPLAKKLMCTNTRRPALHLTRRPSSWISSLDRRRYLFLFFLDPSTPFDRLVHGRLLFPGLESLKDLSYMSPIYLIVRIIKNLVVRILDYR